jgi:tetratricopeptide (TPR) repeat protein
MKLPFVWEEQDLQPEDIRFFEPHFSKTIKELFSCETVFFVALESDEELVSRVPERFVAGVVKVLESGKPVVDADSPILYLPIFQTEKLYTVVVLVNGHPNLFQQPISWLVDRSDLAYREFNLVKQQAIDPVTGLLNGSHFHETLNFVLAQQSGLAGTGKPAADILVEHTHKTGGPGFTLYLLEMYPRVRESRQAFLYISRAGGHLSSMVGHVSPVFHLGSGIFGILWDATDREQAVKIGNAFLDWLKREHIVRVHIGISIVKFDEITSRFSSQDLIEQSWDALEKARQRGPYSLCMYADPDNIDAFSQKAFTGKVIRKLKRLWENSDSFVLVLLHQDQQCDEKFLKRALSLVGQEFPAFPVNDDEVFVFFANTDRDQAQLWAAGFRQKIKKDLKITFSMGMAMYPDHDFTKSDMPVNARKALVHTGFFGPGTSTVFDAVSLNISGDVYYNEGYLTKAVKDYRQGLFMNSDNTNLLNSLGVAYAQMNRHNAAIPLFEKALRIDSDHFMAWANLGFSKMAVGKNEEAVACFEKAMLLDDSHFDLLLHLGRLYCQTGTFENAVNILTKAEKFDDSDHLDIGFGTVHRYLGEAYKELGDAKNAMKSLQRAVRHNPRDAGAMSLLGEVYAFAGEGNEIALSLCHQAVDLDDTRWKYWYRLANVQFRLGYGPAAETSLKECLRRDHNNPAAAFLLARVYDDLGKKSRARRMYEKVLKVLPANQEAEKALADLRSK